MPGKLPPGLNLPRVNAGRGGGGNFSPGDLRPRSTKVPPATSDFPGVRPQTAPKRPVNVAPPKVAAKAAPVTHPQLPPTSGKTTVPARTVTPHPAPTTPTKAAPVAPRRPARTAASAASAAAATAQPLTADQAAAQAVTAALAPLYGAQKTAAAGQNTAITNLTKAVIQALAGGPGQVGGEYDRAIGQQTNLSNAAADALRQANPNTQDQALLSAINAPAEQQAQLAAGNNAAFNGAAAVGQYVGGVLPASSLQAQKLAAMGLAHQQPVIEGLRGQQSLSAALTGQRADRAKIDAMRPDLIQKYSAAYTAQSQKQQYLDIVAQKFGYQQAKDQANFTYKTTKDQRDFKFKVAKAQVSVDEFNTRQAKAESRIDVTVSKGFGDGLAHNSSGAVISTGGKPVQFNAAGSSATTKQPTASQLNTMVDSWKTGKTANVHVPVLDKNGKPVLDQNGVPRTQLQTFTVKQLGFGQAYRRLRAMGVPDVKARQYLTTAYKRGEQGRAWVTNEEQSVLRKAGLPPRARLVQGHGVLTLKQAHALQKAGRLPAGQQTSDGFFVIAQTY